MKRIYQILHVIDDEKFVPFCKETFTIENLNNHYCTSDNFEERLTKQLDLVVIHGLNISKAEVLLRLDNLPKVVWFMWGADAFCLGNFYNKFLLPRAKRLRVKLAFREKVSFGLKTIIKTIKPSLIDRENHYKKIINAFSKIDCIVPVVPGDYDLLKAAYNIEAPVWHLNYVNPLFDHEITYNSSQNNILIGNSASFTSNHLDVINTIGDLELGQRKVIIPLNYGNSSYGDYIEAYANYKLPGKVECLRDYLPFEEYQKKLSTCGIIIMNHLRQQAMGNIVQGLMNGSHIYLNPKSSAYQYLKGENFIVSDIGQLDHLRNLVGQEQDFNREKCLTVFGKEAQQKKIMKLVRNLEKRKIEPCLL